MIEAFSEREHAPDRIASCIAISSKVLGLLAAHVGMHTMPGLKAIWRKSGAAEAAPAAPPLTAMLHTSIHVGTTISAYDKLVGGCFS